VKEKKAKPLDLNTPLLSLTNLIHLLEIDKNEKTNAIALIIMIGKEKIAIKTDTGGSKEILKTYNALVNNLQDKIAKRLEQVLKEVEAHMDSFLHEQKDIFYSLDDAVMNMIEEKRIPAKLVKAMLGGKWPNHDFNFNCIDDFILEEDGTLVPNDGLGEPAPGPDFKLKFKMINDPTNLFRPVKKKKPA